MPIGSKCSPVMYAIPPRGRQMPRISRQVFMSKAFTSIEQDTSTRGARNGESRRKYHFSPVSLNAHIRKPHGANEASVSPLLLLRRLVPAIQDPDAAVTKGYISLDGPSALVDRVLRTASWTRPLAVGTDLINFMQYFAAQLYTSIEHLAASLTYAVVDCFPRDNQLLLRTRGTTTCASWSAL